MLKSTREHAYSSAKQRKPRITLEEDAFNRRLIEKVRHVPTVWDRRHEDHKKTEKLHSLWRQIGTDLKKDPIQCATRWKGLRDSFIRINKTLPISDAAYQKAVENVKWRYFRSMEYIRQGLNNSAEKPSNDADLSSLPPANKKQCIMEWIEASIFTASDHGGTEEHDPNAVADPSGYIASPEKEARCNRSFGEYIIAELNSCPLPEQHIVRLDLMKACCDVFRKHLDEKKNDDQE